jgi:hypothetical protein
VRRVRAQGTRLGVSFLGAGAVAVATLEIVSRVAGAFDPRPVVSVGLIVSGALLGLTLQRLVYVTTKRARERDRDTRLSELLRSWPPLRCAASDPMALGVRPARFDLPRGEDGLPPYVAREADRALGDALREGGLVLVSGPAGSGKSRTAYEVVRELRPDDQLIVPEDAEALRSLISSAELDLGPTDILWLDDLQRFTDQLDSRVLRLLERRDILTLATLREETLARLGTADGPTGERGRRLLAAALVVHLPARLTPGEVAQAAQLLPSVDIGDGFGAALSPGLGAEQPVVSRARRGPRRDQDHVPSEGERDPLAAHLHSIGWFDPVLIVAAGLTFAVLVTLALSVAVDGFSRTTVTIGQQVDDIRARAAEDGRRVDALRKTSLHGPGITSYVLLLRDEDFTRPELRIYDEQEGKLKQRLTFRPANDDLSSGKFFFAAIEDLDHDDDRDILAGLAVRTESPFRVPIVISWGERNRKYVVQAALPEAAPLSDSYQGRALQRPNEIFTRSYELTPSSAERPIRAFAASEFAVAPSNREDVKQLLTGVTRYPEGLLSVGASLIGSQNGRIVFGRRCDGGDSISREIPDGKPLTEILRKLAPVVDRKLIGLRLSDGDCGYGE